MANIQSDNRKIAKNTFFLYIRKFLSLAIALYSSRVLLQTLGVDNFGLYGLVGSIVGIFNTLRGLFATSIQRFLNVEKHADSDIQNRIFSMGISIHVGIAIIFFIAVEIGGLLMLPHLNIHPEKTNEAFWVLQFSIFSAIVTILTVPYDALMMAKEKFDIIALFSLLDSILRLGVIFLLIFSPINKLIFYSILLFAVSVLFRVLNAWYCSKNFHSIAKFKFSNDRKLFKEMTVFAGWNSLGNIGLSLTTQGLNFVLNYFGGVIANAARTIAYQVNDNIRSFVFDVNTAFLPQSMMAFKDNKERFYSLQFFSSKLCSAVFLIFVFPVVLFTRPILEIWLSECPPYAVIFIQGVLVYSIIKNLRIPIDVAFKSANKMKNYQICELIIMGLNIPFSCISLYFGAPIYWVFFIMAILEFINLIFICIIAKSELNFPIKQYLKKVVEPVLTVIIILSILFVLSELYLKYVPNFLLTICGCCISVFVVILLDLFFILTKGERIKIISTLKTTK